MNRTVYLNGKYVDESEAKISIFDRALLFSDALYEVTSVLDGKLIDFKNLYFEDELKNTPRDMIKIINNINQLNFNQLNINE